MQIYAKVYKVCLNYCAASFIEDDGRVIKGEERVPIWNFFSYCKAADKTAEVLLALLKYPAVSSQFRFTQQ